MPLGIGPLELIIVLVIVLIIFGPKRLPQLGRQLGGGMREFKDSITNKADADDEDEQKPALTAAAEPVETPVAPQETPQPAETPRDQS